MISTVDDFHDWWQMWWVISVIDDRFVAQEWCKPDPSLSSASWLLLKRPTQSSRRCRSKNQLTIGRLVALLFKQGATNWLIGKEHLVDYCGKRGTLIQNDWGQQLCFGLDKQTNKQQASGDQMVGFWIQPLVIWLLATNLVFSICRNIKVNSCWSPDSKFIFE